MIAELVTGSVVGALMSVPGVRHARRRVLGRVGQRDQPATFLFADLVGYTALTERCGDDQAAHIARAFARGVSVLSRQHGARHVKSTGDGAMIWAPDAGEAVALAARLVSELGTRPDLLPVRVGAYTGAAIRQDGDWYGRAVNLAARLSDAAAPNEALVSEATRAAADRAPRAAFSTRRELRLRGVTQPVEAWRVAVLYLDHCLGPPGSVKIHAHEHPQTAVAGGAGARWTVARAGRWGAHAGN